MQLPTPFLEKMQRQLGAEFPAFLNSYNEPRVAGVRGQSNKISPVGLGNALSFLQTEVPWAPGGFYYDDAVHRPAKHPYYYAGMYYIQEPSAMLPAALLDARPGERVLDLCAAPGGKSVQLASQMRGDGLLVVNDIHPQRAKILLKNIERYGVRNAVVLNERPENIAEAFGPFFHKILVDAPCSGEGMFRKDPDMVKHWSPEEVRKYSHWQRQLLQAVPTLVGPRGEVVYSTCTFSVEEDEDQISSFLSANPGFERLDSVRLWPHRVRGEGHFAAKLQLAVEPPLGQDVRARPEAAVLLPKGVREQVEAFSVSLWGEADAWERWLPKNGRVIERAGHVLWEHNDLPNLRDLKVLRSGWLLGTVDRRHFRPTAAYALGLPNEAVTSALLRCDLSAIDETELYTAIRYLRGETIEMADRMWRKGWHLVCIDGFALGWAKGEGSRLKNGYPPGWRWTDGEETQ